MFILIFLKKFLIENVIGNNLTLWFRTGIVGLKSFATLRTNKNCISVNGLIEIEPLFKQFLLKIEKKKFFEKLRKRPKIYAGTRRSICVQTKEVNIQA